MRKLILVGLVIAASAAAASTADARHRHRHRSFEPPATDGIAGFDERIERRHRRGGRHDGHPELSDLIPRGWQLQPPDASWKGKRFVSPDGTAWFAAYPSVIDKEPIAAHMKTIAFGDGEAITYLRGERNWIAVSGIKGDRIFYRKAIVACSGKSWHHIAFEYPVVMKREMDRYVARAAAAVEQTEDEGCDDDATPSASQPPVGSSATR